MEIGSKNYEIAYLVSPQTPEEDVFGEAGKITGFIQDAKGFVGHIEEPRKIRLAYPIKKQKEAYFGWTSFNMTPEGLGNLEKKLKLEKAIFRYLTVIAEEEPFRPRLPRRAPSTKIVSLAPAEGAAPEEKINIEELDKRLEEILGK